MPKLIGYVVKGKKSSDAPDEASQDASLSASGSGSSPPDVGHRGYPDQGSRSGGSKPGSEENTVSHLPPLQNIDNPRVGPPPDALVSRATAKTSVEYVEKFIPIEEATAQIRSIAMRDIYHPPSSAAGSSVSGSERGKNYTASEASNCDASSNASQSSSKKSLHRISPSSLQDMRRVSKQLQCDTTWFRVVHSGYGQDAWRVAVQNYGLTVFRAHSPAEGIYVRIPEDTSPEDMVLVLTEINLNVRKKTRFKDMNRANKSRLHFKVEPFVVSAAPDGEKPALIPTTRFTGLACQKDDDEMSYTESSASASQTAATESGMASIITGITGSTMDDSLQSEDGAKKQPGLREPKSWPGLSEPQDPGSTNFFSL